MVSIASIRDQLLCCLADIHLVLNEKEETVTYTIPHLTLWVIVGLVSCPAINPCGVFPFTAGQLGTRPLYSGSTHVYTHKTVFLLYSEVVYLYVTTVPVNTQREVCTRARVTLTLILCSAPLSTINVMVSPAEWNIDTAFWWATSRRSTLFNCMRKLMHYLRFSIWSLILCIKLSSLGRMYAWFSKGFKNCLVM